MKDPIYIIGHQNPDVDAICSAIAYAEFKKASGHAHYIPARCGNSNDRINATLEHFKVPLPVFVGDVTPRVRDIMVKEVYAAHMRFTCFEAMEILDEHHFRALPVVDDANSVQGLISVFELGQFFLPKPKDPSKMRWVYTSINAIKRSIKATALHLCESDKMEPIGVCIASTGSGGKRSACSFNLEADAQQQAMLVGDCQEFQAKAIELGVRLLILTDGCSLDPVLLKKAVANKVSVLVSQYDAVTTAWSLRSASKIHPLVDTKPLIFGMDETLSSVRRKVSNAPTQPLYIVVGERKELAGVFQMTELFKPVGTKIVLVDHNEMSQAVPGAAEANILEIIDHHRLGNPPTTAPILFYNEPVGSTCTIVADLFRKEGLPLTPQIAGLMMAGLVSDTLNLHSPTATPKDQQILKWLEQHVTITPEQLASLMFNSGSVILKSAPEEVIHSDCKIYTEGTLRFSVAQVEELGFNNFWQHAQSIEDALEAFYKKESLLFAALLVTDVNTQNSVLVVKGQENFIEQISYPALKGRTIFDMPGIVSRKKQLIPYLTTTLKGLQL